MDDREGDEGGTTPKRNDGGEKNLAIERGKKEKMEGSQNRRRLFEAKPAFLLLFLAYSNLCSSVLR